MKRLLSPYELNASYAWCVKMTKQDNCEFAIGSSISRCCGLKLCVVFFFFSDMHKSMGWPLLLYCVDQRASVETSRMEDDMFKMI